MWVRHERFTDGEGSSPGKMPLLQWCRLPVFQHGPGVLRLHNWRRPG